jgi:hypothetical protein
LRAKRENVPGDLPCNYWTRYQQGIGLGRKNPMFRAVILLTAKPGGQ